MGFWSETGQSGNPPGLISAVYTAKETAGAVRALLEANLGLIAEIEVTDAAQTPLMVQVRLVQQANHKVVTRDGREVAMSIAAGFTLEGREVAISLGGPDESDSKHPTIVVE